MEKLASEGLQHDPKSLELRYGLVFSIASQGCLDRAEHLLNAIPEEDDSGAFACLRLANRGLIALRRGQITEGVSYYRGAMVGFQKLSDPKSELRAMAYFAREAARANLPEALTFIEEAEEKNAGQQLPEVARVLDGARLPKMSMAPWQTNAAR